MASPNFLRNDFSTPQKQPAPAVNQLLFVVSSDSIVVVVDVLFMDFSLSFDRKSLSIFGSSRSSAPFYSS
jgi:hypothetical protein